MKSWVFLLSLLASAISVNAQVVVAPGCPAPAPGATTSCDTRVFTISNDCTVPAGAVASLPAHCTLTRPVSGIENCSVPPGVVASLPWYCLSTLPNGQVTLFTDGYPDPIPTGPKPTGVTGTTVSVTATGTPTGSPIPLIGTAPTTGSTPGIPTPTAAAQRLVGNGWVAIGLVLAVMMV